MESKTALKNQGFTLIELLVSLLVISILVSLGYANFRKYAQKQALWAVARQIEGDLRLAQSYAMSGKDASNCDHGTYLYGYQLIKNDNSSYKIRRVCRNPGGGSLTYSDVPPVRYISTGFEIYNNFPPVLFRSVVGGVDSATSINIRRISTTSPYIVINVSLTGTISLSYNE
jgi:prepilin-type N-terminal cleavage/methylation domain-containing protein